MNITHDSFQSTISNSDTFSQIDITTDTDTSNDSDNETNFNPKKYRKSTFSRKIFRFDDWNRKWEINERERETERCYIF